MNAKVFLNVLSHTAALNLLSRTAALKVLSRTAALALLYYVISLAVMVFLSWIALASLADRYAAYSAMADRVAKLEGHVRDVGQANGAGEEKIVSPFLEGDSLTIAGAALQKRATGAVEEAGGNVLSAHADLQEDRSESEQITLTISFEIEQGGLQKMLYDIETGTPYLFIDRLAIQSPESPQGDASRLKITMNVVGQWQQTK